MDVVRVEALRPPGSMDESFVPDSCSSDSEPCSLLGGSGRLLDFMRSRIFITSFSSSATRTSVLLRWRRLIGGAKMHTLPALAHRWHWAELGSKLAKQRTLDTRQASHARFKAWSSEFLRWVPSFSMVRWNVARVASALSSGD